MQRGENAYERALGTLRGRLVSLGELVGRQLADAVACLAAEDGAQAQQVLSREDGVDDEAVGLEMEALEWVSLKPPTQEELRLLWGLMRMTRDLERIGDYATDIARVCVRWTEEPEVPAPAASAVTEMGRTCSEMLAAALQSLAGLDVAGADRVNRMDDRVDRLFHQAHAALLQSMREDPRTVEKASYLFLVARYLERVGDHVVNLAEMVVYIVTGRRRPFRHRRDEAGV